MKRIGMGGALVSGVLVAALWGGPAVAMPPVSGCLNLGGNHYGCCDDHATAVSDSTMSGGWGCSCNDGFIGVAQGNSSVCAADPGGWGNPPTPPPTDPGTGGGGGGVPGGDGSNEEPDCVEAPVVVAPHMEIFGDGVDAKEVLWTDEMRAAWDDLRKKNPPPKPPASECKDKKKAACQSCSADYGTDTTKTKKKYQDCLTALDKESTEMCHRGILADGRLVHGRSQSEACFQASGQHWDPNCPSAVPEHETECHWDISVWDDVCTTNTDKWDECTQTYYRGAGQTVDHNQVEGSVSWAPIETINISLGGSSSETITWGPAQGGLKRCNKERDARNNVRDSDNVKCAKATNDKYHGGTKCFPQ